MHPTGLGWKHAALTSSSAEGSTHSRPRSATRYTSSMVCIGTTLLLAPSATRLRNRLMWRLHAQQHSQLLYNMGGLPQHAAAVCPCCAQPYNCNSEKRPNTGSRLCQGESCMSPLLQQTSCTFATASLGKPQLWDCAPTCQ